MVILAIIFLWANTLVAKPNSMAEGLRRHRPGLGERQPGHHDRTQQHRPERLCLGPGRVLGQSFPFPAAQAVVASTPGSLTGGEGEMRWNP